MKKFAILLLALVMALSLAACGGGNAEPAEPAESDAPVAETPVVSDELVTNGVTFSLPDGFEQADVEGFDAYYKAADNSAITVLSGEKDPNFALVTKEGLEELVLQQFQAAYADYEVQLTSNDFNFVELDGVPAYFWDVTVMIGDSVQMRELLVGLNADYSYAVTYTDASADESHIDSFYESADTITLNREAA